MDFLKELEYDKSCTANRAGTACTSYTAIGNHVVRTQGLCV